MLRGPPESELRSSGWKALGSATLQKVIGLKFTLNFKRECNETIAQAVGGSERTNLLRKHEIQS